MSKIPPEAHTVLGTIWGIRPNVAWADDPDLDDITRKIDICVEVYEGEKMAYVAGLDEGGTSVRIDIHVDGWRQLAELAAEVHARMAKAIQEDLA